ncbi:HFX_2341 family transcriptional regulator domain-containing protein [Herpetosiphon llansteffanensis]|uniref:HFX_2341 family transcriptional regulator domain-containing protein n=1 Tax=Herpetosiphon llansteffanensis TaxID=2094568 RepID=UPI000D7C9921|nr:DUF1887 family CARF protein [Herpetosiphon llansteffanensis]
MKILLSLVGAQPLPNLIPIYHLKPDLAMLIYTNETVKKANNTVDLLKSKNIETEIVSTNSYDIPMITQQIEESISKLKEGNEIYFNVTGGTKPMSFAASQVARKHNFPVVYLESEAGKSKLYTYDWKDFEFHLVQETSIPPYITLEDWLDVHLGLGNWSIEQAKEPFEQAVIAILEKNNIEILSAISSLSGQLELDVIYRNGNHFGIIEIKHGKKGTKIEGTRQLNTTGLQLGIYSNKILIITEKPGKSQLALADASNVKIISINFDGSTIDEESEAKILNTIKR